jgi:hypothetical protein
MQVMSKKQKKSYKKLFKKFAKNNKLMMAALGGAVTGITLSTILGSDKARQIVNTIDEGINNFSGTLAKGMKKLDDKVAAGKTPNEVAG